MEGEVINEEGSQNLHNSSDNMKQSNFGATSTADGFNFKKGKVDLENIDFTSKKRKKINSPRSLETLSRLGYTQDELYYINFKEFKNLHPDVRNLAKDVQESRFQFFEDKRSQRVEEAKQLRLKIINEENFPGSSQDFNPERSRIPAERSRSSTNQISKMSKSFTGGGMTNNMNTSQFQSTAINNELKSFERLKKKQEMDLLGMVQHELRMNLMRQENEEKIRKQKEKEEKIKMELMLAHKKEEEKKKQKELERQEMLRREEEQRKKRDQERYQEEQRRLKEEMEREKQRMKENRLKQEEEKRKQEEFKKQVEMMLEDNRKKAEMRQKELEEKERERKELLERKKLQTMMINSEKSQRKREKIETNMLNLEHKILQQKNEYLEKQRKNEIKKNQFEELRNLAFKEQKKQSAMRTEEIKKVLMRNEQMEKQKVESYYEKQKQIQQKKEELEEIHKEEIRQKIERQKNRENKIKQTLQMNELMENAKKNEIIEKIEFKEERKKNLQMMKERECMEKSEIIVRKKLEKEENIKRIARMQEYERAKTLERLQEKSMRLEEFKLQKSIIADKKREIQDEISRKKQEYVEKFEKIFKKKNIDEQTVKTLVQMFPDNEEIQVMANNLRTNNSSTSGNFRKTDSRRRMRNTPAEESKMSKTSRISQDGNSNIGMPSIQMNKYGFNNFTNPSVINRTSNNSAHSAVDSSNKLPKTDKNQTQSNKDSYKNTKNKTLNDNDANKLPPLNEKDIAKKLDEFRLKLNQNLLKLLSEERQKEDERERVLAVTTDSGERKKLEKYFGYERAQASTKIVKFNE